MSIVSISVNRFGYTSLAFFQIDLIHAMDVWYPSTKGHNVLAEAAFTGLQPSPEFWESILSKRGCLEGKSHH